jgi:nucleotide-binding universal stress UspA family protein
VYQRFLIPLDGSGVAEQVLPYVRILSSGIGADIGLYSVVDDVRPTPVGTTHRAHLDRVVFSVRNRVRDYQEGDVTFLQKDGLSVSCTVCEGDHASDVASPLAGQAKREPATPTAMATRGRSRMTRWLMGSAADEVPHATASLLFLIRPRPHENGSPDVRLKTIIIPLDRSAFAKQVLHHVVPLADDLHLRVIVIQVTLPPQGYSGRQGLVPGETLAPVEEPAPLVEVGVREYLNDIRGQLSRPGMSSVEIRNPRAVAVYTVMDVVERVNDSVLVMPTHRRSPTGRWWLGSVGDRVVRNSRGPVLLVRPSENWRQRN